MLKVRLAKIKTRDGVSLDGIYIPPRRKSTIALIWLHGLTSSFHFSHTLIKELSSRCGKLGIGYFKFDTRGHDIVTRGPKGLLGTVFEKFEHCISDIRAVVNFAQHRGYRDIILAGHSTGANKAVYYLYKTKDRRIKGLVLLGALNDITAEIARIGVWEFKRTLRMARNLHRRDPLALFTSKGHLYSARRYLSLYTPGTAEDVFPYYNPDARWKAFGSIRVPTAVILGSRDEYLDRPAKQLVEIFRAHARSTKSFSGIIIKGGRHSFQRKEKELAKTVVNWIKKIK